jgi:RNA polymerase sigma factor (sigma-70 family)
MSYIFNLGVLRGDEGSSHDRDAEWLRVFRHFDPRLRDFFARRTEALSADEVAGEVWGRAFLFISTLKDSAALWSWLTTIGNNVIRDRVRSQLRRPTTSLSRSEESTGLEESFVRAWIDVENSASIREEVRALISGLSLVDREFLRLVAVDGLSHTEVAIQLGLSSAAASRQRLRRLRLQLQNSRKPRDAGLRVLASKEVEE